MEKDKDALAEMLRKKTMEEVKLLKSQREMEDQIKQLGTHVSTLESQVEEATEKENKLKALDSFWDSLGGKTTDLIDKVK